MTMRKKTTWAASVVRKQLQTCCQHETLSLDTHEPGEDESCDGEAVVVVVAAAKDPPVPSLFRRRSFNASHSRSLLTTPEPQLTTPYRKSVDSSLPLCTGAAAFKPRKLQYVARSATPPPKPKSGPLPLVRYSSFKGTGPNSPVKLKKYLSGPLPSLQRNTPAPSPPIKMIFMSGKAKELRGAAGALTRVKSSLLPPTKLPGMVRQGTLKKAAQLAKVTPVLERKGSRHGSGDGSRAEPAGMERVRAAVKIQAAMRGYRARKELAARAAEQECASVSTRMSRTNPNPLRPQRRSSVRVEQQQVSKSWNGSLCTAQDCQARLKSKQDALRKRERALEYAMSRQRWKKLASSGSRKSTSATPTPASWVADNTFPDKPGWVWNWLERAARMGAHNSPNRIFDNNDFDAVDDNPVSDAAESLSIKSTVGVCTTELGSAGDMMPPVTVVAPMTYPWPLSLRQQHAAGLLRRHPSPLDTSKSRRRHPSVCRSGDENSRRRHPSVCRSGDEKSRRRHPSVGEVLSTSCVTSDESKPVRKLEFAEEDVASHGGDSESVGSCGGPLPSHYRLSSPFGGPRLKTSSQEQQLVRMSHPNSLNPHHKQQQPRQSVSDDDDDSAGTTAASVRRPFWRP